MEEGRGGGKEATGQGDSDEEGWKGVGGIERKEDAKSEEVAVSHVRMRGEVYVGGEVMAGREVDVIADCAAETSTCRIGRWYFFEHVLIDCTVCEGFW